MLARYIVALQADGQRLASEKDSLERRVGALEVCVILLMGDNRRSSEARAALEGLPNARVRDLARRDIPTVQPPAPPALPVPPSVERALRASNGHSRNGHSNGATYRSNGESHP